MDENQELDTLIKERCATLPPVVQRAILSSDVEKHLRELADTHKLHLDQWDALETEVQLTLLGVQPEEKLQENIEKEVHLPSDIAHTIANDIAMNIFEPIRQQLEKETEAPPTAPTPETPAPAAAAPAAPVPVTPAPSAPTPATPPKPAVEGSAVRAPISPMYRAGESSTQRRTVDSDPYREAAE